MVLYMTAEDLETEFKQLPAAERLRFVEWLDGNRDELIGNDSPLEVSRQDQDEARRRLAELDANPSMAQTIDKDYFERMKSKAGNVLTGKASAG